MLAIQEYIIKNGLDKTISDFALDARFNASGDRVHLSYNQINSFHVRFHPVCREARGIILSIPYYEVISFSFPRFFNLGEEENPSFDFFDFKVFKKEDGSIMSLYYDKGDWHVKTSGTFDADCPVNNNENITFKNLFWSLFGDKKDLLNPDFFYVFELCSRDNKVVVDYPEPKLFLLTVRDKKSLDDGVYGEFWPAFLTQIATDLGVSLVEEFKLDSLEEVKEKVSRLNEGLEYIAHEGFVLVDNNFNRLKIKNADYLLIHKIKGYLSKMDIAKKILAGEKEEVLAILPEYKDLINQMEANILKNIKKWYLITLYYKKTSHLFADKKQLFDFWHKDVKDNSASVYFTHVLTGKKTFDIVECFSYIAEMKSRIKNFIQ